MDLIPARYMDEARKEIMYKRPWFFSETDEERDDKIIELAYQLWEEHTEFLQMRNED